MFYQFNLSINLCEMSAFCDNLLKLKRLVEVVLESDLLACVPPKASISAWAKKILRRIPIDGMSKKTKGEDIVFHLESAPVLGLNMDTYAEIRDLTKELFHMFDSVCFFKALEYYGSKQAWSWKTITNQYNLLSLW